MKDRTRNITVGLTVLAALAILGGLIVLFAGLPSFFQRGQTIYVKIDSAAGLRQGDPIHIADIRVGRVTDIGFTDPAVPIEGVTITARINEGVYVSPNSVLVVHKGMMGWANAALEPSENHGIEAKPLPPADERPPGPLVLPGLVIYYDPFDPLKPSIETVTTVLGRVDQLTQGLVDTTDRLSGLITSLHSTASRLEDGEGTISKFINDPELYDELVSAVKQMNNAATQFSALAQRWAAEGIELKME